MTVLQKLMKPLRLSHINRLQSPMSAMLHDPFFDIASLPQMHERINCDVTESAKQYRVVADVPGFAKDRISISVHGNMLVMKGDYESTPNNSGTDNHENVLSGERIHESFERVIQFGADIDEANVTAELKDGVLDLKLPKTESTKGTPIEIH